MTFAEQNEVKSVHSFNVSLNGKSQMCRKEQIVPRIGKQNALARSKHIQMHCSNILKKEAWQAKLLAFYYYLYYRLPQGEPIALESGLSQSAFDLFSINFFSVIMFCTKGTVKLWNAN